MLALPDTLIEQVLSFLPNFDVHSGRCAASSKVLLARVEALCQLSFGRLEQRADSTFRVRVGMMSRGGQSDAAVANTATHTITPEAVLPALPWRRLLALARTTHLCKLGREVPGKSALGVVADSYLLSNSCDQSADAHLPPSPQLESERLAIDVWDISCRERIAKIQQQPCLWDRFMSSGNKLVLAGRDHGVAIYDVTHDEASVVPTFELLHRIRGLSAACVSVCGCGDLSGDALFSVTEEEIPFDVQDAIPPVKLVHISLTTGHEIHSTDLPEGLTPSLYAHMCASGGGHLFIPLCHRADRGSDDFINRKARSRP